MTSHHQVITINDEEQPSDASRSHRHHVEIATLSLPAAAAESGVQSGDGTNFILEAPTHIIDELAEIDGQQQQPCIEGVVDLDRVSHLVTGISDAEFVGLLHHDVPHHVQHHRRTSTVSSEITELVEKGESLMSSAIKVVGGEDQPLLSDSSNIMSTTNTTACLSLSADPFVQTLLEVHHHGKGGTSIDVNEGEGVTVVETIGATDAVNSFRRSPLVRKDNHVVDTGTTTSREAFLLSIPKRDDTSSIGGSGYGRGSGMGRTGLEMDDQFVLALSEWGDKATEQENGKPVEMASGIFGSIRNSSTNMAKTVAGIANEIEHAFDPLPTDVQNVDLRVSIVPVRTKGEEFEHQEVHLDVVVDRKVPIIGYVILVAGLIALSSVGAALDLQKGGVTPEMKIFWRLSCTSIIFFWLAANKLNREEFARFSFSQLFLELPFAAANYAIMNTTFAVALEMTSLVNAFILSNLASLLMIGAKYFLGIRVLFLEGLGALIGFAGALICAAAGSDDDDANNHRALLVESGEDASIISRAMMGNIIAFTASIAVAIYLTVAKRCRPHVDLVLFMFLIFTLSSVFSLLYIVILSGQEYEFSFDPVIGLFGWVNLRADRLLLELYVAIICNGVGTMGYIAIMKYFDPVVVSMVMLLDPIVATFIGLACGVSGLPGWLTWVGDIVVMVGSFMVIYSGSKSTETIDATDALGKFGNDEVEGKPKITTSPRLTKMKMMHSPLISKNQRNAEEMEFVSVGRKTKTPPESSRSEQRVVWSSMKSGISHDGRKFRV